MAILIIASLAMVEIADVAPRGSGLCAALREWHAQAGLAVLALIWFRIAWRMDGQRAGYRAKARGVAADVLGRGARVTTVTKR